MYKIQEVVHKFRSGSTSGSPDKKAERGEDAGGTGGSVGLSCQATDLMSALASLGTSSSSPSTGEGAEERESITGSGRWYRMDGHDPDDDLSGSCMPLMQSAELSSLPVITPAGIQQTPLTSTGHKPDPMTSTGHASDPLAPPTTSAPSPEKRLGKNRPKGTVEYKVGKEDTLEKIAAHFDVTPSELKKLNRLSLYMVFENQVLYIPDPKRASSGTATPEPLTPVPSSPVNARPRLDIPIVRMTEKSNATSATLAQSAANLRLPSPDDQMNFPPPPASAPPIPTTRPTHFLSRTLSNEGGGESIRAGQNREGEGVERFLKLSAQMISEGFEKVPGTLLVTPNAIMFEPDLMDDRVIEEGAENYGAVIFLDTVLSAAIYHDLSALRFHTRCGSESELLEKPEVYHGEGRARSASASGILDEKPTHSLGILLQSASKSVSSLFVRSPAPQKKAGGDATMFPLPPTSQEKMTEDKTGTVYNNDNSIDAADNASVSSEQGHKGEEAERRKGHPRPPPPSLLVQQPSQSETVCSRTDEEEWVKPAGDVVGNSHMGNTASIIGDMGRLGEGECQGGSVNERSGSEELRIGSIMYLPVEEDSEGQVVVRTHATADAAFPAQDGGGGGGGGKHRPPPLSIPSTDGPDGSPQSSGGSLRSRGLSESFSPLKSSAQQLSSFVNYAAGFFRSSHDDRADVKDVHDMSFTPDSDFSSMQAGPPSLPSPECRFLSAVKAEERPELFRKISDLLPHHENIHKQPALYFHLRVDTEACDKRVAASTPCQEHRHQTTRPHYWFSVPRNKGDHLYAFFVHWRPDLYGDDDINPEDHGFVVVDRVDVTEEEDLLPFMDDHFGQQLSSSFKKDWEIVSRGELRRRASVILDLDHNIMPELSEDSSIMSEHSITELSGRLPARTVGYRWCLQFSTGHHGFSLRRLYRQLAHLDSPILMVIHDSEGVVFGAYLSDPPRISDHFYGTGTCQLWTLKDKLQVFGWTGDNPYFIKGDENSLAVGASHGSYGLWVDGDLYHGHSQECTTFGNCVLSCTPDFFIKGLEAWAFLNA